MDGNGRPQGEEPCAVTTIQMFRQDARRGKAALRTLEINVMAKRMTPQNKIEPVKNPNPRGTDC